MAGMGRMTMRKSVNIFKPALRNHNIAFGKHHPSLAGYQYFGIGLHGTMAVTNAQSV